ncbi:myrosinase 1-like isoform X1 [Diprion similis]|uniref:myrosinase 1-like isoform X1 n=1 Tax=Diprion similis TaxID=362088 RepID=UPI001EF91332|nr:myrosinase 1-like isoform X1 [Diprion similis]XP_046748523.1 myrosinase 1-like isoform X1 [Diprion similis]
MAGTKETTFPKGFKFGVGTASYQIEGGWNEGGKGENIWDRMTHSKPDTVEKGHNGDIACDSYHKYEEDIKILDDLGVDFYRFSFSWSRILPTGFTNKINPDGIRYYNNLIDGLIARGIEPMGTIFHWDLPQPLQELGGWQNEALVDYYTDYAEVLFENFGDRVKTWFTFNEPWVIATLSHGGVGLAPATHSPGVGVYLVGQTLLKSHAKAYHLYQERFKSKQKGRISMVIHWFGYVPKTDAPEDVALAEKAKQFKFGWFAHPIFSAQGDYPQIMKDAIAEKSAQQGFPRSRLPELGKYWVDLIRGTADFIAVNTYTALLTIPNPAATEASWINDCGVKLTNDGLDWPESMCFWHKENPVEFGNMFRWIRNEYGDREIIVTENGWPEDGSSKLEDWERIRYVHRYLAELLIAIHRDKINITGYTHWSLMDNFEWIQGYTMRFGLYYVDFEDPSRPRTIKKSGEYYRDLISKRRLPEHINEELFASDKKFAKRTNLCVSTHGKETFLLS